MVATAMTLPMTTMKRKREEDQEDRVYTCKTCNMEFSTFQALGGHRAGHNNRNKIDNMTPGSVLQKSHTCFFCFEKFVSGQALGGHMRKHRDAMEQKEKSLPAKEKVMTLPIALPTTTIKRKREDDQEDHVYPCKTCNMEFSTFQALGGHRAGHKNRNKIDADVASGDVSTKSHTCSFCFENFVSGQALGGHMRKHRDTMEEKVKPLSSKKDFVSEYYKEDKTLKLWGQVLAVESEEIHQERCVEENSKDGKSLQLVDSILVEEEPMFDFSLTLALRDFFSREPVQVKEAPATIIPVVKEEDKWLQLTV